MNKFEFTSEGKVSRLRINGYIDEKAEFPKVQTCDKLIIDLDGLTRLNSFGIRVWLTWIQTLTHVPLIELENCGTVFLQQVTMIKDIIPRNGTVKSFYVPFYDVDSDASRVVKMVRGIDFDDNEYRIPQVLNAKGKPMELDVAATYFGFLKRS